METCGEQLHGRYRLGESPSKIKLIAVWCSGSRFKVPARRMFTVWPGSTPGTAATSTYGGIGIHDGLKIH